MNVGLIFNVADELIVVYHAAQAVGAQQYDQAAGSGDVHIFDLNAIRDKKVAANADLKPLIIGVGRTIRGMELSADGKSLFVVTTVTSGKTHKSVLTKYDAETRKPVGAPVPLPEAAWDMCKSPDGKNLACTRGIQLRDAVLITDLGK